ncbi:MAG: GPI anchored serine-threonine rich family protein [Ignavibacteriaceae bacterium]|nr:GPI anchored serine-threonine rich family protein [Ignavibacteriaceae bacterium]
MKAIYLTIKTLLIFSVLLTGCREIFGDREQPESIVQAPTEGNSISVYEPVWGTWGTIYHPGDTVIIKWSAPIIKRLDISLYRKTEFKFTILSDSENKGKISWVVPNEIASSNHYCIKINNHNNADTYNFSKQFGIHN